MGMDPTLRRLRRIAARLERDMAERDRLVLQARSEGKSQREIARAARLSHVAIGKIEQRGCEREARGA